MKVVIFAGGKGTRISEVNATIPKPMIQVGGKPIIWHIMCHYQHYGFNDFIICLGYKGEEIKKYFTQTTHDFNLQLIDTGENTLTAGRLQKVKSFLHGEDFMLTYGDGLSDVNLKELVKFHKLKNKICTITTIQPTSRYGRVYMESDGKVSSFNEKPFENETWINGGFFVLKNEVFEYLKEDLEHVMWERSPMENIVKAGEMVAFKHFGFWKCMDTPRDKEELEELWLNKPQWKVWEDK